MRPVVVLPPGHGGPRFRASDLALSAAGCIAIVLAVLALLLGWV
jgi:hypothetical protein